LQTIVDIAAEFWVRFAKNVCCTGIWTMLPSWASKVRNKPNSPLEQARLAARRQNGYSDESSGMRCRPQ